MNRVSEFSRDVGAVFKRTHIWAHAWALRVSVWSLLCVHCIAVLPWWNYKRATHSFYCGAKVGRRRCHTATTTAIYREREVASVTATEKQRPLRYSSIHMPHEFQSRNLWLSDFSHRALTVLCLYRTQNPFIRSERSLMREWVRVARDCGGCLYVSACVRMCVCVCICVCACVF